jgi:hypothetical protein
MAAASTFTLTSTTFGLPVLASDSQVLLASTTGVTPGTALYVGREQMLVDRLTGISTYAVVRRGQNGTVTRDHSTGDTVWIGSPDWFFSADPQGYVVNPPLVEPYINVLTGDVWYVQGDDIANAQRTWQKAVSSQIFGSLGVRVDSTTIPS